MNSQIPQKLSDDFFAIAKRGDESAARKFLIDNLQQFSEDAQNRIIAAMFEDALVERSEQQKAAAEIRKQAIEEINVLGSAKEQAEKKLKMLEIKESI